MEQATGRPSERDRGSESALERSIAMQQGNSARRGTGGRGCERGGRGNHAPDCVPSSAGVPHLTLLDTQGARFTVISRKVCRALELDAEWDALYDSRWFGVPGQNINSV